MTAALSRYLPDSSRTPNFGGTSFWVRGPDTLDAGRLGELALEEGIVIEPGQVLFAREGAPRNYFRLGFSTIPEERIEPGIRLLAGLIEKGRRGRV
jgi:GntR family transcriptional regulator/MocR family aminotransferase